MIKYFEKRRSSYMNKIRSINIVTYTVNYNNCDHKGPSKRETGESKSVVGNVPTGTRDQSDALREPRAQGVKSL